MVLTFPCIFNVLRLPIPILQELHLFRDRTLQVLSLSSEAMAPPAVVVCTFNLVPAETNKVAL